MPLVGQRTLWIEFDEAALATVFAPDKKEGFSEAKIAFDPLGEPTGKGLGRSERSGPHLGTGSGEFDHSNYGIFNMQQSCCILTEVERFCQDGGGLGPKPNPFPPFGHPRRGGKRATDAPEGWSGEVKGEELSKVKLGVVKAPGYGCEDDLQICTCLNRVRVLESQNRFSCLQAGLDQCSGILQASKRKVRAR